VARITDKRQAELAKIHIAKKQLGLDDETYRDMLWTIARVKTASELDEHGRRQVIEHLKSRGFRDRTRPVPALDRAALVAKVRAQLFALDRPETYADAMSRRMFHVDRFEWCHPGQLHKLVAALTYAQQREAKKAAETP
jgi:phage gp16-like protein